MAQWYECGWFRNMLKVPWWYIGEAVYITINNIWGCIYVHRKCHQCNRLIRMNRHVCYLNKYILNCWSLSRSYHVYLFILPRKKNLWYDWIKDRHQKHWNWASARNRIHSSVSFLCVARFTLEYIQINPSVTMCTAHSPFGTLVHLTDLRVGESFVCVYAFEFLYIYKCTYIYIYLSIPSASGESSSHCSIRRQFRFSHQIPETRRAYESNQCVLFDC